MRTDITQNSRVTVAVARSRRKKQSLRGMRRRGTKQFTTLRLSESKDRLRALPSKSKVKPRRGLMQNSQFTINGFSSKVRFHRCHSEAEPKNLLISSIYSSCARPGRLRGSHLRCEPAPGARVETLASALPHQRNSRNVGHACHNCHSERSESTNAASAEAACGLCRARRRKTNVVQSRIYSGQGYRCFAALNMTVAAALRKEVNDKRSAVKHLYADDTDSSSLCSSE